MQHIYQHRGASVIRSLGGKARTVYTSKAPSIAHQQLRFASRHTKFRLSTGADIPALGFGTWQDKDAQFDAVSNALAAGYRHIDTARVYGTEPACGDAIAKAGLPRDELFITTKLWNNSHHPDHVEAAMDASLKDLNLDYVDLYLMHWPVAWGPSDELRPKDSSGQVVVDKKTDYLDTWKAMEALVKSGKAKAIGVSNFSHSEMERLLKHAHQPVAVHQIELHPWLAQPSFMNWHRNHGVHVTQYSPFGNSNPIYSKGENMGRLIEDETLVSIGKKYGKSGAQVALAWGIARGRSVIPKSKTPERIKANLEGDFKLDEEDVRKVDNLDKKFRFNDPSESFGWSFYADLDGK